MPVVADFKVIVSRTTLIPHEGKRWKFDTGGRIEKYKKKPDMACIIFNLRNLRTNVDVVINDTVVGTLFGYPVMHDFQKHWFSQNISFEAGLLSSEGNTTLRLQAFPKDDNTFDEFQVKSVVCFYHQKVK